MGGGTLAVVRLWHGKVPIEKADEYERFLIDRAVPDYGSVDGLQKLYFLRRNEDVVAHFLLITIWDSLESIKSLQARSLNLRNTIRRTITFYLKRKNTIHISGILRKITKIWISKTFLKF